jgi:ABC-2 type transport system ATP-binding protein
MLQGIPRRQVAAQAAALLGRVRLTEAAGVRSGAYSGGMRRRLSVAIALLGAVLFLSV